MMEIIPPLLLLLLFIVTLFFLEIKNNTYDDDRNNTISSGKYLSMNDVKTKLDFTQGPIKLENCKLIYSLRPECIENDDLCAHVFTLDEQKVHVYCNSIYKYSSFIEYKSTEQKFDDYEVGYYMLIKGNAIYIINKTYNQLFASYIINKQKNINF